MVTICSESSEAAGSNAVGAVGVVQLAKTTVAAATLAIDLKEKGISFTEGKQQGPIQNSME
ncbi:MAG: hypothetical protein WA885_14230 [Phormidesmis sp.]